MSHRKLVSIVDLCTSISNISYHLNQLCVWRKIYCTQHFAYTVRESTFSLSMQVPQLRCGG
ncbi:hypothetical protein I7I48_00300 [Histoplasma ohiense]|nr:hypothetical protein I7I48_00300 [Histoplasma ohiense (nom. inval.)]